MAKVYKHIAHRLVKNKLFLLVAILGIIFLSDYGDASPSTSRKVVSSKSANKRASRSTGSTVEKNIDYNTTLDSNDEKMCSDSGSDRPACIKAGLNMKNFSLELIKQDILKKLRLDVNKLPNVTAKDVISKRNMLAEYVSDFQMLNDSPSRDDSYDDEHATTEKIITFARPGQAFAFAGKPPKQVHEFKFSEKMANMRIESATLYVRVSYNQSHHHEGADKKHPNFSIKISVLTQKKGESPVSVHFGTFKPIHRVGGPSETHVRHSKWFEIDIREPLTKWVSSSSRKIALDIEAVDDHENRIQEVTVVGPFQSDVNSQHPFVEVHVSDGRRSRQARNIGMTCDEHSQETRCCKYPLTVDFEEFGWDWIIAPKTYDANYCSGQCPFAFLQKYPHNHIIQQAVPSGVGGPCCAARKLSAISMLYFDGDSNIVYSVLPGMVVERCGCS